MKIAAVIVTFNRKELLVNNIKNCLQQTQVLNSIYIIDNASSDGTEEYLFETLILPNDRIKYIKLSKNTGGAGGFYSGLKTAYDNGNDLFWMMDDDGCPDLECLEELVQYIPEYDVLGPLIYCEFEGLTHANYSSNGVESRIIEDIKIDKLAYPVHPFNGTLISREVVTQIGFPEKLLFIWGDEQEYRFRWLKAGFKEASVTTAMYFHPTNKLQFKKFLFFKIPDIKTERKYLYYRNQAWIYVRYRNIFFAIISLLVMFVGVLLFEDCKIKSLHGFFDGIRGNLENPRIG